MALRSQSLILYGYEIGSRNCAIDFQAEISGPILQATLRFGFYSLSTLLEEIRRAMQSSDNDHNYDVTADRTISNGLENRITIAQESGTFLSLLFASGPRTEISVAPLIGFNTVDQTGAITYTGTSTSGVVLVPELPGYNYLGPDFSHMVFGNVNISVSGVKEAVVFAIQRFIEVQFKYEPEEKWVDEWLPLIDWIIQQRPFDFTPQVTIPDVSYNVTLETSMADGKGLGFKPREMLPEFPFFYDTGPMELRVTPLS